MGLTTGNHAKTAEVLFGVKRKLFPHRTPDPSCSKHAEEDAKPWHRHHRQVQVARHLPGMSAKTTLPVIGRTSQPRAPSGGFALLIVQMPGGVPVATMAIG